MDSNTSQIKYDTAAIIDIINCELVMGENVWLKEPILNKAVLVDKQRRIRGYFITNEISEIERLDTELDILISYE